MLDNENENKIQMKKRGIPVGLVIGIVALIFLVVTIIVIAVSASSGSKKAQEKLDLGKKYLSELNYEQAIIAFNEAIEIDPKNIDAYIKLAEVYVMTENYDKAEETLIRAEKEIDSEIIKAKKDEVKKAKEEKVREKTEIESLKPENTSTDILTSEPLSSEASVRLVTPVPTEADITTSEPTIWEEPVSTEDEVKKTTTDIMDNTENTYTSTEISDVVSKAMPSIVSIDCVTQVSSPFYGTYDAPTAGSGIIIEQKEKELMIATNNHVVEDAKDIKVTFNDGTTAAATVKGKDDVADLAVIAVKLEDLSADTLNSIAVAKLGNSDDVKIGEIAIAIGNSLGYGQSVTVGYISAKDRDLTIDGQTYSNLLQTDAAINPGNSGGALVNINGEVIGINNAKVGGTNVEGMGYAIPISRAQNILADFAARETLSTEEQGFLGVSITSVTDDIAKMYNWPTGAYVSAIVEGGAAEKAGIMVGDIITAIDDTKIKTDRSLVEKIQSIRYGKEIKVTLQRLEDGEFVEKNFTVVLGQRPAESTK